MNTALLLIDIQNDYFPRGANPLVGAERACQNALQVLTAFRELELPAVHVQHISLSPSATFFLPNTHGAALRASLTPLPNEKQVVKHTPNSFIDTNLLGYLQDRKITNLVICGMMTHMCVDATVRAAKDLGFSCTLISDACATKDLSLDGRNVMARDVQISFLAALNETYATVISAEEYLSKL